MSGPSLPHAASPTGCCAHRTQRRLPVRRSHLTLALASVALASSAAAEDWPQFRGHNGCGVSACRGLPVRFSHSEHVAWSAELGDGIGSPIVSAGRVVETGMTGPTTFSVFCHDAATGTLRWRRDLETGKLPRITPPNSHASSTPAADGERVYVYFSTLGLLAFDLAEGKQLWRLPLPVPAYLMDWGAGASPIVHRDLVIFCQDDDLNPFLIAADAATGEVRWKTPRSDMLAGYAIPVICEAEGRTDVVIAGSGMMKGYDPGTGRELWTCNTLLRTIMTSPVVRDGVIYLAVQSYGDASRTLKFALLEWLDTNQDGRLVREELPKEFQERFAASDRNGDGAIAGEELDTAFQSPNNQAGGGNIIQAIRGGGSGDVTKTHVVWSIDSKSPSNLSSALVVNGRLHVVKRGGLSSCFDARDGKTLWSLKRVGNLGDYYASPVAADGKVYLTGENGFVVVLEDGPELRPLAKNDLGESCLATPAIADGRIYFRTREKVICFAEK